MGILAAAVLAVRSMYKWTKRKITGQLYFGRDIILPNQSYKNWRHTSEKTDTDRKRNDSKKLDTNRLRFQHWR